MSEPKKHEQSLFTDSLTTRQAFDEAKTSGKLWMLDDAPRELVDDVQREFFSHRSAPVDVKQGDELRECVASM